MFEHQILTNSTLYIQVHQKDVKDESIHLQPRMSHYSQPTITMNLQKIKETEKINNPSDLSQKEPPNQLTTTAT